MREQIPLAAAIGVRVLESGPARVCIQAPLEPNMNHRSTAFGGSVAALAILAGWALVHTSLVRERLPAHTVIQASSMRYDAPIDTTFRAVCEAPEPEAWARFTRTLARRGRARIRLAVHVESEGKVAARGEGAYVALGSSAHDLA